VILLFRTRRNGKVDLLICLAEENIERIRRYDAAEVIWPQLPREYSMRMPSTIGITFCTAEEQEQLEKMSATDPDWKEKAFALLTRGFEFKPDMGDHDFGPTVLGKPTEGAKN
jgi:hypothetical protein